MNSSENTESPKALDILLHDGPCIFINKPGGLLTQGPPGIDSLENRVRRYTKEREGIEGNIYMGVPHRLDRPVAGVIVFGRHQRATQRIAAQFEHRQVRKKYWAVVDGLVEPDEGTWTDFMRKVPDRAISEITESGQPKAQLAVLDFKVLSRAESRTWLEIELQTGRTHQIRLQAASRGFPIVGDELYGSATSFGPQTIDMRARWIALLARRLKIRHPMEDRMVEVVAPVPECWRELAGFDFPAK